MTRKQVRVFLGERRIGFMCPINLIQTIRTYRPYMFILSYDCSPKSSFDWSNLVLRASRSMRFAIKKELDAHTLKRVHLQVKNLLIMQSCILVCDCGIAILSFHIAFSIISFQSLLHLDQILSNSCVRLLIKYLQLLNPHAQPTMTTTKPILLMCITP
jgi:hypothetical protein